MGDIKKGDPIAASIISGLFAKLETIRVKHANKGQESGVSPISWNRGVSDKINYSDDFNQIVTKTNQVYTGSKYLKNAHTYTEKTSGVGQLINAVDFNFWGGTKTLSGTVITSGVVEALDAVCAHDAANYTNNNSGYNGAHYPTNYTSNRSGYNPSNYTSNRSGYNPSNYTSNRSGYNSGNYTSNRSGYNSDDYPSHRD